LFKIVPCFCEKIDPQCLCSGTSLLLFICLGDLNQISVGVENNRGTSDCSFLKSTPVASVPDQFFFCSRAEARLRMVLKSTPNASVPDQLFFCSRAEAASVPGQFWILFSAQRRRSLLRWDPCVEKMGVGQTSRQFGFSGIFAFFRGGVMMAMMGHHCTSAPFRFPRGAWIGSLRWDPVQYPLRYCL
jgi:hypothetical protein